MCGIIGLIGKAALTPDDRFKLHNLSEAMIHRGPDGEGTFDSPQFSMRMRRLSIIDLNGGWQPLFNEDESIALVANGEVYNYIELRKELEARGHQFRTGSDCETIAHLYEEYGDDVVHKLRGMYAFALYDRRKNRVLLVRDRMGEKPMYLVEGDGKIAFSSELRCMVRAGIVPFELDPVAVYEYLHYQYVPEPRCAIKGVRKLPAGHLMSVELDGFRVEQKCYWRMEDAPPVSGDPSRVVRAELERVAELIVRSDVPVGIALSSGIDSSAIAALAQKNYPGTLQGFTVGYEGSPRQDERVAAQQFADHIKMPLHAIELRDADVVEDFPNMVFMRDDPISDISGTGYLAVMRAARAQGVRVMLMGHGGDELFWGYPWVREALFRSHLKQKLRATPSEASAIDYLRVKSPPRSIALGLRWLKGAGGLLSGMRAYRQDRDSPADQLVHYDTSYEFGLARRTLADTLTPSARAAMAPGELDARFIVPQPWGNIGIHITSLICQTYLLENGLAQGDRLSMAASVELRVPLVDYRFVETVVGLMKTYPSATPAPKAWLREAVRDIVPDFVMNRRKTGFNAPSRRWMPAIIAKYGATLDNGYLVRSGFLRPEAAKVAMPPLNLITLELWCQGMLEAAAAAKALRGLSVAMAGGSVHA